MPRVSVIVTAFNVEPYIEAALRSVLDQTMPDFELLAVDDGSTDATGALCDRVAATDGRVRVIHQGNAGPSVARNAGLAEASGEYVAFLDGDDVLAPRFLETLMDAALRTGAAVAVCDYAQVDPSDPLETWAGDRSTP